MARVKLNGFLRPDEINRILLAPFGFAVWPEPSASPGEHRESYVKTLKGDGVKTYCAAVGRVSSVPRTDKIFSCMDSECPSLSARMEK